ncbi:MAG: SurA N-terminal domain-containing protein [Pirellulales bacterium]|nr:SurA N-terminal domain-containing protein [Pirellulales bacterium]
MASPFRYFRKHTKAFMAVAAVLAIFIFVVGDSLMGGRNSGYNGRPSGATVATWNGGSLTEYDLATLTQHRRIVDEFLRRLFVQGGGTSLQYDFPQNIPQLFLRGDQEIESQVVETEVLADLADKAGITVSDQMINRYLEEVGLNKVGGDQILSIFNNLGNSRQTEAIVFATLRKLLAADFYRRTYADAAFVVLPQQKWEDWRKVNERIALQVASIPAEKFLDKVPAPTEAQLQAFYNDYKDFDPDLMENVGGRELPSPRPGFAVPHRVKLQYLLGAVDAKAQQLLDSVTDAEIAAYYQEHKEDFLKMDFPAEAPAASDSGGAKPAEDASGSNAPAGAAAPTTEAAPSDGATPPADSPAGSPPPEAALEGPEVSSAPDSASTPASAAGDAQPPEASAETGTPDESPAPAPSAATDSPSPATEEPAADPPAADAGTDEGADESSNLSPPSPFRLAAFQEEATEPATETAADESAAAADADPAQAPASAASSDVPAAEGRPQATEPAAESASAPAPDDAAATGSEPAAADESAPPSSGQPAAADSAERAATQYEPLEKVRDEIRQVLARKKAEEQLGRILAEATTLLEGEYNQYGIRVAETKAADQPPPTPPERLTNLDWLAKQNNLTFEKTTALTARELFDTAIGKAGDADSLRRSVTQEAFTSLALYQPFLAKDMDGNYYLVQKIEDAPHRIPERKEVRDQVAEAWKREQAAKLAEAEAKKLAEEISKSSAPFDQFFFADRGYPVVNQTQFFSWRSYPPTGAGMGRPPGLSDVPELKNVGPQFMETAFSLEGNETKAVMNYDNSVAYVIRLARRQWSPEELRQLFLEEQAGWPGQLDMLLEHYSRFSSAVEQEMLQERADFKWDADFLARRQKERAERGA